MTDIVGIDLGTTFSAVAYVRNGVPEILPNGRERIVPSVVGFSPQGELLVGTDGAGAFIMQRGTLVPLPGYPSDTASTVRALLAVPDGGVVLGTKNGAYRWRAGTCSAIRLGILPESIGALALGGTNGRVIVEPD